MVKPEDIAMVPNSIDDFFSSQYSRNTTSPQAEVCLKVENDR